MSKRIARFAAALVLPLLLVAGMAAAQDYPTRPLRIVIGYAPGGLGDLLARMLADKLAPRLGQAVVVENRVGSGGTIAAELVAKAAPDGYTLLQGTAAETTYAPSTVGARLPYDPARDLAPITMLNGAQMVLVVHPSTGFTSVKDLVDYAKANPGKLNYASFGNGSSSHFAAELFKGVAGLDMVHIPYKGSGPAVQETMAGRVQILFDTVASSAQHVRASRLVALAVTGNTRAAFLPQVPLFKEAGYPAVELQPWAGLFAPAGTPPAIIQRLNREVRDVLLLPEISDKLKALGAGPTPGTPEELGAHVRAEIARVSRVVDGAKLKFD